MYILCSSDAFHEISDMIIQENYNTTSSLVCNFNEMGKESCLRQMENSCTMISRL